MSEFSILFLQCTWNMTSWEDNIANTATSVSMLRKFILCEGNVQTQNNVYFKH